jgi:3-oxoacyl-[acyl-carrier protein] reductase
MDIQGKVALITGASRGIGRAIAIELAQQGIKGLILVARDRQKLAEVAEEIENMGVETTIMALDLTKSASVNIAVAQLWRSHGPIHL